MRLELRPVWILSNLSAYTGYRPSESEPAFHFKALVFWLLSSVLCLCGVLVAPWSYAGLQDGLVAHYCFDDPANLGKDCSGNGNDGESPEQVLPSTGFIGGSASFSGLSNPAAIRVPNSSSLMFNGEATFSFAVNMASFYGMDGWGRPSNNGGHAAVSKSHDRSGFSLMISGNENQIYSGVASYQFEAGLSNGPLDYKFGEWVVFTYVFSNATSTATAYANGKVIDRNKEFNASFDIANTQDIYLGKFSDYWYSHFI